jgi:hypothetical protein
MFFSYLFLFLLILFNCQPVQSLVVNFHSVFTAENGFGGRVPTTWEVLHGMGLGGRSKLILEGVHVSPSNSILYLTIIDHNGWHKWFEYITQTSSDSEARWQRSMFMCNTPSKVRIALKSDKTTTKHLDFSKKYVVGMNGETKPKEIDFFAYGRYSVILVSCRGNDNSTQRVDVSGRIQVLTEAPSQIPLLFGSGSGSTPMLTHLGYGESIYPFVWSVVLSFYTVLLLRWLFVLLKYRSLLWRRNRVSDERLLVVALLSLGCKVIEASLKLSHYNRLSDGQLYLSILPFVSSIMEAASASCLLLLLALSSLGISISRVQIHVREVIVLFSVISVHFMTGLLQAFCRESSSPTAVIPPSSSSSISSIVRKEYSGGGDDNLPSNMDLDQYYLLTSTCEVLIFSEYVIQALVMLGIIIALNYNIASLRQHIAGVPWQNLTHELYDKLECFNVFRTIFMLYLLAPTVLLVIQIMILTWRYNWMMTVMIECTNITMYYLIHTALFPFQKNPFISVKNILYQESMGTSTQGEDRMTALSRRYGTRSRWAGGGERKRSGSDDSGSSRQRHYQVDGNRNRGGSSKSSGEEKSVSSSDVLEIDMDW